jgi:hypothetical protein
MTDTLLSILQHALGTDQLGRGTMYRDHFVAGPGHSDFETCMAATAQGLMRHYEKQWVISGHLFIVTDAGRDFVRVNSPKPDAKQRRRDRYSRWLDISDLMPDLTFGDFLRREKEFARD